MEVITLLKSERKNSLIIKENIVYLLQKLTLIKNFQTCPFEAPDLIDTRTFIQFVFSLLKLSIVNIFYLVFTIIEDIKVGIKNIAYLTNTYKCASITGIFYLGGM